jgi:hypothetical protein
MSTAHGHSAADVRRHRPGRHRRAERYGRSKGKNFPRHRTLSFTVVPNVSIQINENGAVSFALTTN